jgi:amidase
VNLTKGQDVKSVPDDGRITRREAMATGIAAIGFAAWSPPAAPVINHSAYDVEEKSIPEVQRDLSSGLISSEELVGAYVARIGKIDVKGPALHSIIALNQNALADARKLDSERRASGVRGPLHGIPVLIKDNIESDDGTATTAGSLALAANVTHRDAAVVRRIKEAGGIILGKANLAEWALIRSTQPIDGWSAVGGLVKNPYVLDRSAGGSSSGTGAAIAASLATVGVGTETDCSITCPAAFNGLVGLKPTVGLISRAQIVPISQFQDTPGPMGRMVQDVAILLTIMAGSDPADVATMDADAHRQDYLAALANASLTGKRLGVLRFATGFLSALDAVFEQSLATLRREGAEIVEINDFKLPRDIHETELMALLTELKVNLNVYLASTPVAVSTRTLADVIRFNSRTPRERPLFGQELFERAQMTGGLVDERYRKARASLTRIAGRDGIDKMIIDHGLNALIAPSFGPAYRVDLVTGDHGLGEAATLPAIAGYPHLTVPMGFIRDLPVGMSFIGGAWTEAELLGLGAAFEKATHVRRRPSYIGSIETLPSVVPALMPAG